VDVDVEADVITSNLIASPRLYQTKLKLKPRSTLPRRRSACFHFHFHFHFHFYFHLYFHLHLHHPKFCHTNLARDSPFGSRTVPQDRTVKQRNCLDASDAHPTPASTQLHLAVTSSVPVESEDHVAACCVLVQVTHLLWSPFGHSPPMGF